MAITGDGVYVKLVMAGLLAALRQNCWKQIPIPMRRVGGQKTTLKFCRGRKSDFSSSRQRYARLQTD